jgi:hypothetical protein
MADRSWFYASDGQQRGPYPEAQLRDLIARGAVAADTLVWSEGMAGWEQAGAIPGLFSGASRPPVLPRSGAPMTSAGGSYAAGGPYSSGGHGGGSLSIEPGLWGLLGQSLFYGIGILLVIPAPWAATSFYRWMASRVNVPGRPNLAFDGQVGDIWYVFVGIGLLSYAGVGGGLVHLVAIVAQAYLSWMTVRWIAGNLSSNGRPLPIAFNGSAPMFIGWHLLLIVSAVTIVGWAWVATAWMRWNCRNITGTHREIVFLATGLEMLWRTLVFAIACGFLIPIPWMLRWYTRWYVSQFELVAREA